MSNNQDNDIVSELVWGMFEAVTEPPTVTPKSDTIYLISIVLIIAVMCAAPFVYYLYH